METIKPNQAQITITVNQPEGKSPEVFEPTSVIAVISEHPLQLQQGEKVEANMIFRGQIDILLQLYLYLTEHIVNQFGLFLILRFLTVHLWRGQNKTLAQRWVHLLLPRLFLYILLSAALALAGVPAYTFHYWLIMGIVITLQVISPFVVF